MKYVYYVQHSNNQMLLKRLKASVARLHSKTTCLMGVCKWLSCRIRQFKSIIFYPGCVSCRVVTSYSAQRSVCVTHWESSGSSVGTPWAPPCSAGGPPTSWALDGPRRSTGPGPAGSGRSPWWWAGRYRKEPVGVESVFDDEEEEEDVGVCSWNWGTSKGGEGQKLADELGLPSWTCSV